MRFLWSLLSLRPLLAVCVLLACGPPCGSNEPKTPERVIPVVKTWKDLEAQQAIKLDGSVTVRLGIEATRVPRWSGALLYCLTEGFVPPEKDVITGNPLGPLEVRCDMDKGPQHERLQQMVEWKAFPRRWRNSRLLFVRPLLVNTVGKYRVQVLDRKGLLIATTRLEGTETAFHPWMPWARPVVSEFLENKDGDEATLLANVANAGAGIALPFEDGRVPTAAVSGAEVKGRQDAALPTLLPAKPDAGLKVKLRGKDLVIESNSKFVTSCPDDDFLVRWWVNGRPFVPRQLSDLPARDRSGLVFEGKKLILRLVFSPQKLKARKGDRVGLQLLHCPAGWSWSMPEDMERLRALKIDQGHFARLCNLIEFVVGE